MLSDLHASKSGVAFSHRSSVEPIKFITVLVLSPSRRIHLLKGNGVGWRREIDRSVHKEL